MAGESRTLVRNGISLAGIAIVTISAAVFLVVFFLDLFGFHTNPYLGIVFFLIAPAIFIFGLALIPIGVYFERRRRAAGHPAPLGWPRLDLNDPRRRAAVALVLALTLVNIVIVSLAAYRGIEFMDSPAFCGQVCHEVMEPEFAAYQDGPHSRIACVQCHIGPGAPFFVKAKIDGVRQVFAVLMDSHSRPIPSPVHNLRPAREVCEQCHWPEKFHGDKIEVRREFAEDEASTETATTLRIHVGGGSAARGIATGIHWHMNVANVVEYIATDDKRQVIPWVRLTDTRTGAVRVFQVDGVTQADLDKGERRTMDCMDCHNRPSHTFSASPERAVDAALSGGELPRGLPFIRREAVAALKANHPDREAALQDISSRLTTFYRSPGRSVSQAEVARAVAAIQRLYSRNVFPKMKVTWGSYPNNIGHMDAPGCFRCHDDNHKTREGQTIKQDCTLCHEMQ